MASHIGSIMADDTAQGIIKGTGKPNFCQEFASSTYEEKVIQVLHEFFGYVENYITSMRKQDGLRYLYT